MLWVISLAEACQGWDMSQNLFCICIVLTIRETEICHLQLCLIRDAASISNIQ